VTLTYDTKQPEGREKPRELPFRLLVLGDVGGDKSQQPDQRKVRQLNGRNLGEVIKGLKVQVKNVDLGNGQQTDVLIDSIASFSPDDVLKLLTGQKALEKARDAASLKTKTLRKVDPMLESAWGQDATPETLWPGNVKLMNRWAEREQVVGFQKSYQNSKTLRAALKSFSAPPKDEAEKTTRKAAIQLMKQALSSDAGTTGTTGTTGARGTTGATGMGTTGTTGGTGG
jgi:type VI secretion system ImpB/VipA family protein